MRTLLLVLVLGGSACLPAGVEPSPEEALPTDPARSATTSGTDPAPLQPGRPATVTYVSDGDSFEVDLDGSIERVRMIGINSPERDECFGEEARRLLTDLIDGRLVLLVPDVEETDQYGRHLAYVYLDRLLVNAELARRGAALTRGYEPNTSLQAFLDEAEGRARQDEQGMWSPDTCGGSSDADVQIVELIADAPGRDDANLNGEFLTLENRSAMPVDLGGWTVRDESSVHRYGFPAAATIAPGESLVLFTGCGDDTDRQLYWCSDSPVWDNAGDTAFLIDPAGSTHHRYEY